jgi:hypothetical protein
MMVRNRWNKSVGKLTLNIERWEDGCFSDGGKMGVGELI